MQIVSTYLQTKYQPHAIWVPYKNKTHWFKQYMRKSSTSLEDLKEWLTNPNLMINRISKP